MVPIGGRSATTHAKHVVVIRIQLFPRFWPKISNHGRAVRVPSMSTAMIASDIESGPRTDMTGSNAAVAAPSAKARLRSRMRGVIRGASMGVRRTGVSASNMGDS